MTGNLRAFIISRQGSRITTVTLEGRYHNIVDSKQTGRVGGGFSFALIVAQGE